MSATLRSIERLTVCDKTLNNMKYETLIDVGRDNTGLEMELEQLPTEVYTKAYQSPLVFTELRCVFVAAGIVDVYEEAMTTFEPAQRLKRLKELASYMDIIGPKLKRNAGKKLSGKQLADRKREKVLYNNYRTEHSKILTSFRAYDSANEAAIEATRRWIVQAKASLEENSLIPKDELCLAQSAAVVSEALQDKTLEVVAYIQRYWGDAFSPEAYVELARCASHHLKYHSPKKVGPMMMRQIADAIDGKPFIDFRRSAKVRDATVYPTISRILQRLDRDDITLEALKEKPGLAQYLKVRALPEERKALKAELSLL